uniref:Uncharacterized protein n=1 Tax=Romanomermis culicivorax TaxID=13658 RepID=A0A915HGV0_ROMCU
MHKRRPNKKKNDDDDVELKWSVVILTDDLPWFLFISMKLLFMSARVENFLRLLKSSLSSESSPFQIEQIFLVAAIIPRYMDYDNSAPGETIAEENSRLVLENWKNLLDKIDRMFGHERK